MKVKYLLIAFAFPMAAAAQSLTPTVIASGGNHASASGVQLSYTIGETVITTVNGGSNILTQGFHQPLEIVSGIVEGIIPGEIKVYPNPAAVEVFIETNLDNEQLSGVLTDVQGRIVREININNNGVHSMRVDDIASATYHLTLTGENAKFRKTFNVLITR